MNLPQSHRALVLFPGLTGPYNEKYRVAFESLRAKSKQFGYEECLIIVHPGQADSTKQRQGQLSLTSATEHAKQVLQNQQAEMSFRFVGLSFGCHVAVETATDPAIGRRCEKIVLWGPVPLPVSWTIFIHGEGRESVGRDTNIIDDQHYFADLVPLEHSLARGNVDTLACVGDQDAYVVPAFLDYLSQICKRAHRQLATQVVVGCEHTVFPSQLGYADYINCLLK